MAEDVCEGKKHSLRFRFTRKHARYSIITMLPGNSIRYNTYACSFHFRHMHAQLTHDVSINL